MNRVEEVGFECVGEELEREIKGFMGLYRAYNSETVDMVDVLRYIDDNRNLKALFIKFVIERVEDELENFDIKDFVDFSGNFAPFKKNIVETIDKFVEWLRFRNYL